MRGASPGTAGVLLQVEGELEGRSVEEVALPLGELRRLADASRAGLHEPLHERTVRLPSGRVLNLRVRVHEREVEPRFVVVFQEVSEWKALRAQRDKLLQLATVGACMPSVLHEVKNPLTAAITALEVLVEEAQERDAGEEAEDLHGVLSELRRIPLILEGVGSVGRELRACAPMAVDHALHQACGVLRSKAAGLGVELRTDVAYMPLIPLDTATVRAVVFNLVNNALHASRSGGHVLVRGALEEEGRAFVLEVTDTGHGMSPEVRRACTELFFTTKTHGSGIGLALCREACEGAGGTFEIDSTPGEGTRVRLRVPLCS